MSDFIFVLRPGLTSKWIIPSALAVSIVLLLVGVGTAAAAPQGFFVFFEDRSGDEPAGTNLADLVLWQVAQARQAPDCPSLLLEFWMILIDF